MNVGARIKELREKCGYSRNKLAEWAGIAQTHLRRVELGEADITVGHLRMICDALGISLRDFFAVDGDGDIDKLAAAISALSPKQRTLLTEFLHSL